MPLAITNCVNVLGRTKRPMIVFTDSLDRVVGNYTPTENVAGEEDEYIVNDLFFHPTSPCRDARSVLGRRRQR